MPSSLAHDATIRRPSGNIPALTGFRGFAALIVLLNHAGQYAGLADLAVVRYGYFGVPCFFCLSGALFALLYFDRAHPAGGFLGRYYTARMVRIFPVYWLVLGMFALTTSPVDWADVGWHAVMGHGFIEASRHSINVPMWTLPVECSFYLLAPWLFIAMRAIREGLARSQSRHAFHWTHVASIAGFALALLIIGAGLHTIVPNDDDWWKGTIFGRFAQFGLGVLTGLFVTDVLAGRIRLPRFAGNGFALAAAGLVAGQVYALEKIEAAPVWPGAPWIVYGLKLSFAVTACLLILAAVSASGWQRFLASRPMVYCGAISYSLYLLQCASFGPVRILSETAANGFRGLGLAPWPSTALTMLVCVAAGMLVHHAFEKPVDTWLRRLLGRRPAARPTPPP